MNKIRSYKSFLINAKGEVTQVCTKGSDNGNPLEFIDDNYFIQLQNKLASRYDKFNVELGVEIKIIINETIDIVTDYSYITLTYIINRNKLEINDFIALPFSEKDNIEATLIAEIDQEMKYLGTSSCIEIASLENITKFELSSSSAFKFVHEIISHSFEEDYYSNSKLQNLNSIFKKGVSIYDNWYQESRIDDLGNITENCIKLVEDGNVLSNCLGTSTGNMYEDSFSNYASIIARTTISNIVIKSQDYLSSLERNTLYISKIDSGYVDPTTGEYQLIITHAYVINENDEKSLVAPFKLSGNIDSLQNVELVERSKPNLNYSLCGKRGNVWLVGMMIGSILLTDLDVNLEAFS